MDLRHLNSEPALSRFHFELQVVDCACILHTFHTFKRFEELNKFLNWDWKIDV